jgi:hypothetical protein
MQKEVEQYLRQSSYVIPQNHHSRINRIGACWFIKSRDWTIVKNLFQTITVREYLLLEVIHDAPEEDSHLLKEILPLNASLKALQLRLSDMAEKASRQYIKYLALESGCFWEDNIRENLEMLLPGERESVTLEVEQFHEDLQQLRSLLVTKVPIKDLITLHNRIHSFDDRLTQMRLAR